ncbi:oligosaccharide flippase family protein [Nonomuraea typhae]|uniref:Oligosaccharide flippase family protein n=1 Tax=Nonomuraea typhae TaxID=2603600 RepID=A0ABW7YLF6_9ACTN
MAPSVRIGPSCRARRSRRRVQGEGLGRWLWAARARQSSGMNVSASVPTGVPPGRTENSPSPVCWIIQPSRARPAAAAAMARTLLRFSWAVACWQLVRRLYASRSTVIIGRCLGMPRSGIYYLRKWVVGTPCHRCAHWIPSKSGFRAIFREIR